MSNNYIKNLKAMQVFQNNFLRKIGRVGYYVCENELHKRLKINKIEHKLEKTVNGLWDNLKHSKDYVPKYTNCTTRHSNDGQKIEISNFIDRLFWLKMNFDKEKLVKGKFLIEEFTSWQNEMWFRGQMLAAGIRSL